MCLENLAMVFGRVCIHYGAQFQIRVKCGYDKSSIIVISVEMYATKERSSTKKTVTVAV